jgi:hypothetical protein
MPSLSPQLKQSSHSIPQFPKKLHKMLDDAETRGYEQIVSWSDCGQSFQVHDSDGTLLWGLNVHGDQGSSNNLLPQSLYHSFGSYFKDLL